MIAHFVVCALGEQDLLEACITSIDTFGGDSTLDVIKLPDDTTDPAAHGRAFDQWRVAHRVMPPGDVIVLMDPDCALLSHGWRRELERAMALPEVGIWGAGSTKDYGPRVHASLCAIRGDLWNTSAATFLPIPTRPRPGTLRQRFTRCQKVIRRGSLWLPPPRWDQSSWGDAQSR